MRGFSLNKNLLDLRAEFVSETRTCSNYRIWSIQDEYPTMLRDEKEGKNIDVELWSLGKIVGNYFSCNNFYIFHLKYLIVNNHIQLYD